MKIGILTYFIGQNYGASLQAYATMVALQKLGHEVVFIHYHQPWSKGPSSLNPASYFGRSIRGTIYKCRRVCKHLQLRRKFAHFEGRFPKTRTYYGSDSNSLKRYPPDCDIYLVGSDQVWNCSSGYEAAAAYFLPFGKDSVRKVSYASSMGGHEFPPEHEATIRGLLSSFKAISVREISGAAYLKRIGIPNVACVPDPTLLLTADEYEPLIKSTQPTNVDAMSYILHEQGEDIARQVRLCLDQRSSVFNIALHDFELPGANNTVVSVPEFLRVISSANVVVTNSFHCVVFSILFHRPFHVIPFRGGYEKMNGRLRDFLNEINLQGRILNRNATSRLPPGDPIDWGDVDARLNILRHRGWNFLNSALA